MPSTRTVTLDDAVPRAHVAWLLTVVHHPDPARLGQRVVIPQGESVVLGRDADLGSNLLEDPSVSRRHARVEATASGLGVTDLGSSNGTWREGERITDRTLASGDLLRLGGVMLLVRRVERVHAPLRDVGFPACSEAMARVGAALWDVPEGLRVVLLHGAPFAGVDAIATALAARDAQPLPVMPLPVAAPPAMTREGLFERAADRTVLLGPLPFADGAWQDELVTLSCRARPPRRMLLWWPDGVHADDASARDALARSLGARVIALPSLRDRGEDIPHLVRELALRAHGRAPRLHHTLVAALLRAAWPDDLRDLAAFVGAHLAPGPDDAPLAWTPAMAMALPGAQPELAPAVADSPSAARVTRIARDAQWFQPPGEPVVSLAGRFALARVLRVLVDARVEHPGRGTDVDTIVRLVWSGQRMVEDSGTHRAYVAVSTLRRMGLVDVLTRGEEGYQLDPRTTAVCDDPP